MGRCAWGIPDSLRVGETVLSSLPLWRDQVLCLIEDDCMDSDGGGPRHPESERLFLSLPIPMTG